MKLKMELVKSGHEGMLTWQCVEGYGFWRMKGIMLGMVIMFSRNFFWNHGIR